MNSATQLMVVLVIIQKVNGFDLSDLTKALNARSVRNQESDKLSEGLESLLLDQLDENNDKQISLAEVKDKATQYFGLRSYRPEESIGYMMAIAQLVDVDDSGIINSAELLRAASIVLREIGDGKFGSFVSLSEHVDRTITQDDTYSQVDQDFVRTGLDSNKDGRISLQELQYFERFYYMNWDVQRIMYRFPAFDTNDNGSLEEDEASRLLNSLTTQDSTAIRTFLVYFRTLELSNRRVADLWAQRH